MLTRDVRLEPRHHDLYRQAYLLTGDPDRAVRLAEQALAQVSPSSRETVAEQAKTALVRAAVADPGRPVLSDHPDLPGWQALCRLPARRRAAIVLRFDERLTEERAAGRLGSSPQTVRADVDAALLTLRTAMRGAADPWVLVSAGLTQAGRRWSAALGAPEGPPAQVPLGSDQTQVLRAPVPVPRLGGASRWPSRQDQGQPGPLDPSRPLVLPPVTGPRRGPELLPAGPLAPSMAAPKRRLWPVLAAAAVTVLVVAGGVLVVPVLRGEDDPGTPAAVAENANTLPGGQPRTAVDVPTRQVETGLLGWPARGPLATDGVLESEAVGAWRSAARGAEFPASGTTVLWAGTLDGRRTAVVQANDRRNRPRVAQVAEVAGRFRLIHAEALQPGAAVLSLLPAVGRTGPVRVLVSPEAQAADGLMAVNPMSGDPLRKIPVDSGGVSGVLPSPPGAPTCSQVVVMGLGKLDGRVGSGPRVLASGIVTAEMMGTMANPMNPAQPGSAALAPAEGAIPDMAWFGDGKVLAGKVAGKAPLTVAALGPRVPATRISAADPRTVTSRAYELRRGGRTYLGSVVEVDGKRVCASAWPVQPTAGPTAYAVRCPLPGGSGTAGVVHVVGTADVDAVSVSLRPTPDPPGQRPWTGAVGRPADQQSTSSFAVLRTVPAGFPCGTGVVQVSSSAGDRAVPVPLYTP